MTRRGKLGKILEHPHKLGKTIPKINVIILQPAKNIHPFTPNLLTFYLLKKGGHLNQSSLYKKKMHDCNS
jgi:hypothetical protein